MGKAEAAIATIMGAKEIIEGISDIFSTSMPKTFFEALDKITFLTSETLGFGSNGTICDSTKIIAQSVCNLTNVVICGILLFYSFLSLFQYFLSKKLEIPWKIFARTIIVGVIMNSAIFICFSVIYFTENITQYIVVFCGEDISFSMFDGANFDLEIDSDMEDSDLYQAENLMKVSLYILAFLLSIAMGTRYVLIKVMIIFSPVIFAFACTKMTEKIFFKSSVLFIKLMGYQIILTIIFEIFQKIEFKGDDILKILVLSVLLLGIKIAKKIY